MEFFWIDGAPSGRLAVATRPRGGDWLADDVRAAASNKISLVVSMLTEPENAELELKDERRVFEAAGLQFLSVPVEDRGVPERAMPFLDAVACAAQVLREGRTMVAHCRMGVGRSSMFIAAGEARRRSGRRVDEARRCAWPPGSRCRDATRLDLR